MSQMSQYCKNCGRHQNQHSTPFEHATLGQDCREGFAPQRLDPAPRPADLEVKPVCSTCSDTHKMSLEEREVMCTSCPTPCQKCRSNGTGAYCSSTPCSCTCHSASVLPPITVLLDSHRTITVEALARCLQFHAQHLTEVQSQRIALDLYQDGVEFNDLNTLKKWSPR